MQRNAAVKKKKNWSQRLYNAIARNDPKSALRWLKFFAKNRDLLNNTYYNAQNCTPLQWAIRRRHVEVVRFLMGLPNIITTGCVVEAAQSNAEIFELVANYPGANLTEKYYGEHVLVAAARVNNTNIFALALQKPGVTINMRTDDNSTALMVAARYGNQETFKFVVSQPGIDVNLIDNYKRSALTCAVLFGNIHAVRILLEIDGIQYQLADAQGVTALGHALKTAVGHQCVAIFQEFQLTAGADVISYAIKHKYDDILKTEISFAYTTPYNILDDGRMLLQMAAESNRFDILSVLMAKPEYDAFYAKTFTCIAKSTRPEVWSLFLNQAIVTADPVNQALYHNELFKAALYEKNLPLMEYLLKLKLVDVNCVMPDGETYLMHFIRMPAWISLVNLALLDPLLNVNATNAKGETAQLIALQCFVQGAYCLMQNKGSLNLDIGNNEGVTPFSFALFKMNDEALCIKLLDMGAKPQGKPVGEPNASDDFREIFKYALKKHFFKLAEKLQPLCDVKEDLIPRGTPFFLALKHNRSELMNGFFQQNNAVVNLPSKKGYTPFSYALFVKKDEKLCLNLLRMGARPEGKSNLKSEMSCLVFALKQRFKELATALIKTHNVNIALPDAEGNTALMYAIGGDDIETAELLLSKDNSMVNHQNAKGDTAIIQISRKSDSPLWIQLLVKYGADPEITNKQGCNALHEAAHAQNRRVYHELTTVVHNTKPAQLKR